MKKTKTKPVFDMFEGFMLNRALLAFQAALTMNHATGAGSDKVMEQLQLVEALKVKVASVSK